MKIKVSYKEVNRLYPRYVKQVVKKLRAGKSKNCNAKPAELFWSYDWAQSFQGMSPEEVVANYYPKTYHLVKKTPEQRVEEIRKDLLVNVSAEIGQWSGYSKCLPVGCLPKQVYDWYLAIFENKDVEKDRWDALTPEQQDAEMEDCLKELRKDPGVHGA